MRKRPLRIAILGSRGIPASYSGYETVAEELSSGLLAEGYDVYVSCESNRYRPKLSTYRGVRLVYFPVIDSIRSISEVAVYDALSVFWASLVADVIYMLAYTSILTLIFPRMLRKVVIVNVDGIEWRRPKFNRLLRFALRSFEILATKIADYIVVDSYTIGRFYQGNYGAASFYVPNGIREIEPASADHLRDYGLDKQGYYLVIARLVPDNNIDLIIEGFKRSASNRKLVIVGRLDRSTRSTRKYAARLLREKSDSVVLTGGVYEPSMQRMLRHNCFAYIHGQCMGGTNPSLVEALSCRNLILAIDVPPNREVAEACAIYFKKDPEDLARKIHLLEHASDMSEMRNGAYELYARKYTVQHAVKLFVRLLERIGKNQAGGNLADRD